MIYIPVATSDISRFLTIIAQKSAFSHLNFLLQFKNLDELKEFSSGFAYEPDLEENFILRPGFLLTREFGANCKDFALLGIMWAIVWKKNYQIILSTNHVYLFIDGQIFDPVRAYFGGL